MKPCTVKQLSRLSGVSVRTLHYYDEIGLLKPAHTGANGYRYYTEHELLRLQQILLHREAGLPLDAIGALLAQRSADRIVTLREHRERLSRQLERYRQLLASIDHTIESLEGKTTMDARRLYEGFSPAKQAEYEQWLIDRGGEPMQRQIEASRQHLAAGDSGFVSAQMQRLAGIESRLAEHCRRSTPTTDAALLAALDEHRAWVAGMWGKPCSPDAYAGLADLYAAHPDFRARYEVLAPGLADYLPTAMRAYSRTRST